MAATAAIASRLVIAMGGPSLPVNYFVPSYPHRDDTSSGAWRRGQPQKGHCTASHPRIYPLHSETKLAAAILLARAVEEVNSVPQDRSAMPMQCDVDRKRHRSISLLVGTVKCNRGQ